MLDEVGCTAIPFKLDFIHLVTLRRFYFDILFEQVRGEGRPTVTLVVLGGKKK